MTTVLTRPAAMLRTSGARVKNLFNAVTAHTTDRDSDDYILSPWTQVHIEVQGDSLRLVCSDRYTMGIVREQVTATTEGFAANFAVYADDLRSTIQNMADHARVSLVVEDNGLRIITEDESALYLPGEDSKLPWRRVLTGLLTPQSAPTAIIGLDPAFLARFGAAKPLAPDEPLVARFAGEKAMVVLTLGTVFLGMIAPITLGAAETSQRPLDVWFDLLDEDPVAAPASSGSPS